VGCRVTAGSHLRECYHEASRIGTLIESKAFGTRIDGLNIGPGTCWHRGALIDCAGVEIIGLRGNVRAASTEYPDIAGVEITSGRTNVKVEGQILVGEGSTGIIVRGERNTIKVDCGWDNNPNSTAIRVAEAVKQCTIECDGGGRGGVLLDLSQSGLDKTPGEGNLFRVRVPAWTINNGLKPVVYPGGGTVFNLKPGTEVWVNGVLQK
jgi:hypothetical protein